MCHCQTKDLPPAGACWRSHSHGDVSRAGQAETVGADKCERLDTLETV
jgi:hypothetical protein